MRNIKLSLTVYDYNDREILVNATVSPPVRGIYTGLFDGSYPDEPAEVLDIEATWVESGAKLSDGELVIFVDNDAVIEAALEQLEGDDNYGH